MFQPSLLEKEISVNNKKIVSVNLTTYNRALILSKCLESIINQTYRDIEIIIIDDCSSDNTTEIVKKYQVKDNRIKYFRHSTNFGNAQARNTALENCKGFYVAFIDDDDEWIDKDKIKKQVEIFENSDDQKLGIVCSGIIRSKGNGEKKVEIAKVPKDIKYQVLKGGFIHNSTVLTKKNILEEVGGFDLNVCRGVDSEFFRRMIVLYGYNVIFMEAITTQYNEDSDNRMTSIVNCDGYLKHITSQLFNIKKYLKYLIKKPSTLFIRIMIIIKLFFRYLKCKITYEK